MTNAYQTSRRIEALAIALVLALVQVVQAAQTSAPAYDLSTLRPWIGRTVYVKTATSEERCVLKEVAIDRLVVTRGGSDSVVPAGEVDAVSVTASRAREGVIAGALIGTLLAFVASKDDGCAARGCGAELAALPAAGAGLGLWFGSRRPKMIVVYRRP